MEFTKDESLASPRKMIFLENKSIFRQLEGWNSKIARKEVVKNVEYWGHRNIALMEYRQA